MSEKKCTVTYYVQGKDYTIELESGRSLLEGALIAQINPPYSCLEGICQTCEAEVEIFETDANGAQTSKKERLLTCQTLPESSRVIVRY